MKSKKRIDFVEVEEALTRENYKSKSYQISRFLWSFATDLSVQHYCLEYNAIEKTSSFERCHLLIRSIAFTYSDFKATL